jgi:hypothetical protein
MNRAGLRLRIRERADMVNSAFVTDTEINGLIDDATVDLYDFLVSTYGEEHFARDAWLNVKRNWAEQQGEVTDLSVAWPNNVLSYSESIGTRGEIYLVDSPVPGNGIPSGYALPPDFLRMVRVHYVKGYVGRVPVVIIGEPVVATVAPSWRLVTASSEQMLPMHRIDLVGQAIDTKPMAWHQSRVGYRLLHGPTQLATGTSVDGDMVWRNMVTIQFLPVPAENYAVQCFYVPKARLLTEDTEHLGYEFPEWVVFSCAAELLDKQDSDSRKMLARLEGVKERIRNNSRTLDAGQVPQVVDVYGSNRISNRYSTEGEPW